MKANLKHHNGALRKGFTLLEVILAISILAVITGSIVVITRTTINMSLELTQSQNAQRHSTDLENYLKLLFRNYTSESRAALYLDEQDEDFQTLVLDKVNTRFPLNGRDTRARRTELVTTTDEVGLYQLELASYEYTDEAITDQTEPSSVIILINRLVVLRWEVYNRTTQEWVSEWQPSMGRPSQIRFIYQRTSDTVETTFPIWIPAN